MATRHQGYVFYPDRVSYGLIRTRNDVRVWGDGVTPVSPTGVVLSSGMHQAKAMYVWLSDGILRTVFDLRPIPNAAGYLGSFFNPNTDDLNPGPYTGKILVNSGSGGAGEEYIVVQFWQQNAGRTFWFIGDQVIVPLSGGYAESTAIYVAGYSGYAVLFYANQDNVSGPQTTSNTVNF